MNLAEGNRVGFDREQQLGKMSAVNLVILPERLRSTATIPGPTIPPESSGRFF